MQDSFDFTTIIFLVLTVFVIWKLRSVLGQKTGNEQSPFELEENAELKDEKRDSLSNQANSSRTANNMGTFSSQPPVEIGRDRWKGIAEKGTPLADNLDRIAGLEPAFDAKVFLEGAKVAYEMIITAFAEGNLNQLRDLLTPAVYSSFEQAVKTRENKGQKVETTFVSIEKGELQSAELNGRKAELKVKFLSKLISVTRDYGGNIVDGSPDTIMTVNDIWVFTRELGSNNPTWMLAATESEDVPG